MTMKIANILKKAGQKAANASVDPRSFPKDFHQPKPPAKIQAKMHESK